MKIYRKLVLSLDNYQILEENSYEYSGPVAECKGENKIFKQQQGQAYSAANQQIGLSTDLSNILKNQMLTTFGAGDTYNTLSARMTEVLGQTGPGSIGMDFGDGGSGGGVGGSGGGGGGKGGGKGGNIEDQLFGNMNKNLNLTRYGYDPSLYDVDFTPRAFYGAEEEAMRAELGQAASDMYTQQAMPAFGALALKYGGMAPGLQGAAMTDMLNQAAQEQAAAEREVTLTGAQNLRQDTLAKYQGDIDLAKAHGQARIGFGGLATEDDIARRNQLIALKQLRQSAGAARGANAIQQQYLELAKRKFASDDFWNAAQATLAAAQGQGGYGLNLGAQAGALLQGNQGTLSNLYGTGSQGMVQTAHNPLWGSLISGLTGGAMAALTGGGGLFGGGSKPMTSLPSPSFLWSGDTSMMMPQNYSPFDPSMFAPR